MSSDTLDTTTLELIIRLQLEDLEQLESRRKGKHREGETPDLDVAVGLYKAELASQAQLASDRAICLSISQAVTQDAELIQASLLEEQRAAGDRELAVRLSSRRAPKQHAEPVSKPTLDDESLNKLKSLYMVLPGEERAQAESSSWAASRKERQEGSSAPDHSCVSCNDDYPSSDIARCPCSHEYCMECLGTLVRTSLVDESLFPPRCCGQPISIDSLRAVLPPELVGEFLAKKLEMDTPDRTYCHQPTCSTFVPKQFIQGDVATCVRCSEKTCVICKGTTHEGDCPQDTATQELLEVAAKRGWRRCNSCRMLVELTHGCYHMSRSYPPFT